MVSTISVRSFKNKLVQTRIDMFLFQYLHFGFLVASRCLGGQSSNWMVTFSFHTNAISGDSTTGGCDVCMHTLYIKYMYYITLIYAYVTYVCTYISSAHCSLKISLENEDFQHVLFFSSFCTTKKYINMHDLQNHPRKTIIYFNQNITTSQKRPKKHYTSC